MSYIELSTDVEYREALAELEGLVTLDPDANTPDGDRLELLALLVEEYASEKYKFNTPDPIDALLFRMDQQGLNENDLVPYLVQLQRR